MMSATPLSDTQVSSNKCCGVGQGEQSAAVVLLVIPTIIDVGHSMKNVQNTSSLAHYHWYIHMYM